MVRYRVSPVRYRASPVRYRASPARYRVLPVRYRASPSVIGFHHSNRYHVSPVEERRNRYFHSFDMNIRNIY